MPFYCFVNRGRLDARQTYTMYMQWINAATTAAAAAVEERKKLHNQTKPNHDKWNKINCNNHLIEMENRRENSDGPAKYTLHGRDAVVCSMRIHLYDVSFHNSQPKM